MLLTILGAVGLVLSAVGLYGILALRVSERRRSLGIRLALGETRADSFFAGIDVSMPANLLLAFFSAPNEGFPKLMTQPS